MTVKELIEKLQKINPEAQVYHSHPYRTAYDTDFDVTIVNGNVTELIINDSVTNDYYHDMSLNEYLRKKEVEIKSRFF